jgi:dTDP-4-dehydrorhamnose reductase
MACVNSVRDGSLIDAMKLLLMGGCGFARPRIDPIATADWRTPVCRPPESRLDCDKLARVFALHLPDWRATLSRIVDDVFATRDPATTISFRLTGHQF